LRPSATRAADKRWHVLCDVVGSSATFAVKILVPLKRVSDPHCASDVTVQGNEVITDGLEFKINPFDEAAVEAALRLTENGSAPKVRQGEVVVVTLGPLQSETILRTALACGANRAIHIETSDSALDARIVAHALREIARRENPDLILLGRKTVDGEGGTVGPMLATMLNRPMVSAATSIIERDGALLVQRQVDGASCRLRVRPPAVVSVDLRVMAPDGARSSLSAPEFEYYDGIRFAALPAVMQARKKPLERFALEALLPDVRLVTRYFKFESLPARPKVTMLDNVAALADVLTKYSARL
jgi:electron transfer flavoprotein beta subunit